MVLPTVSFPLHAGMGTDVSAWPKGDRNSRKTHTRRRHASANASTVNDVGEALHEA
jgi:hypothetical protein